jgi:hypothetical protein
MGGQSGGEFTADVAVATISYTFYEAILQGYIEGPEQLAYACLLSAQRLTLQLHRLGLCPGSTGLVAVIDKDGKGAVCSLGDSFALQQKDSFVSLFMPHTENTDSLYRSVVPNASGDGLTRFLGEETMKLCPDVVPVQVTKTAPLFLLSDGALPLFTKFAETDAPSVELFEKMPEDYLSDNATLIEISYMEPDSCKSTTGGTE